MHHEEPVIGQVNTNPYYFSENALRCHFSMISQYIIEYLEGIVTDEEELIKYIKTNGCATASDGNTTPIYLRED